MTINNNGLKGLIKLGLFLMIGVSMSACSTSMNWKEEALQHDGSKIVVERYLTFGGYPDIESIASGARIPLDETVTFRLPVSNKRITWKTSFRNDVPEPNGLNLLILDVVNGIPYLATYPAGCIAYNKWQRPNPPYIFLKYADNEWKRIPSDEFPAKLVRTNVIVGQPDIQSRELFYTVEGVKKVNRDLPGEYQTILRTPGVYSETGCMKMVYDGNGGWMGEDWFTNQSTREACLKVCKQNNIDAQHCPCDSLFKGK